VIPASLFFIVTLFGVLPLSTPPTDFPADKIFHFLAFFWIGFVLRKDRSPLRGLGGLALYGLGGFLLEVIQSRLPYRSFDMVDFGVDAAGLVLGVLLPGPFRPVLERFVLHLGVGRIPIAPATWGSLLALGIYWVYPLAYPGMIGAVLFGLVIGWVAYLDTRDSEDPSWMVLDEVLAVWAFAPLLPLNPGAMVLYFFLFRLMDIVKPLGIRTLESLPGGVFWDDIGAAALAALLSRVILSLF